MIMGMSYTHSYTKNIHKHNLLRNPKSNQQEVKNMIMGCGYSTN